MPDIRVQDEQGKIHVFPDGSTPEMISQAMGLQPSAPRQNYLAPANLERVKAMNAQPTQFEQQNSGVARQFAHGLTKFLPAVGGTVGGILGGGAGIPSGPGAVATGAVGAALGGGAGESGRQLLDRAMGFDAPQSSGDAAKEIGREGASQAAYELGGQAIGAAGRKAAPVLADIAMAPGKRLLKSLPEGVQNIGKTVMDNSSGVRPKTIAKQLGEGISNADSGLSTLLSNADQSGVKVPLTPARMEIAGEMGSALRKNSPDYIQDVGKVQDQLAYKYGPDGKPVMQATGPATKQGAGFAPVQVSAPAKMQPVNLPADVPPTQARAIRQGVDLTIGNWNPESQTAIAPLQERVRGQIASSIHSAVPGSESLDKAMMNLIPAKDAAWNVAFNPSITKNIFNRIGRPTGALVGAGLGAAEGRREGGIPGMVAGGLAGLAVPEMVASPTGQMIMARTLNSPLTQQSLTGAARLIGTPSRREKQE